MAVDRTATTFIGAIIVAGGALLAIFSTQSYGSSTAAWWVHNPWLIWGGVATVIVGIVLIFVAQYYMKKARPQEKEKPSLLAGLIFDAFSVNNSTLWYQKEEARKTLE